MKYIKLFENFSEEEKPKSITIELTDEFEKSMAKCKGYTNNSLPTIELYRDGDKYNMVKVGTCPLDTAKDIQQDYWASYSPDANEIYVSISNASTEEIKNSFELKNGIIPNVAWCKNNGFVSKLSPGYYCKFENGFKVGEVDHRGFFRIVSVN